MCCTPVLEAYLSVCLSIYLTSLCTHTASEAVCCTPVLEAYLSVCLSIYLTSLCTHTASEAVHCTPVLAGVSVCLSIYLTSLCTHTASEAVRCTPVLAVYLSTCLSTLPHCVLTLLVRLCAVPQCWRCAVLGDVRGPAAVQADHHRLPRRLRQDAHRRAAAKVSSTGWTE